MNSLEEKTIDSISNEIKDILHKNLDSILSQQVKFELMLKNIPFVKNILNENVDLRNKCHTLEVKLLEKKVYDKVNNDEKIELKIIDLPNNDIVNLNLLNKFI